MTRTKIQLLDLSSPTSVDVFVIEPQFGSGEWSAYQGAAANVLWFSQR